MGLILVLAEKRIKMSHIQLAEFLSNRHFHSVLFRVVKNNFVVVNIQKS
jgi:hypothetical protein